MDAGGAGTAQAQSGVETNRTKAEQTEIMKTFTQDLPRYYVAWNGCAEDDFTLIDGQTRMVIRLFSPARIGTQQARYAAQFEAAQLNANNYANFGEYAENGVMQQ